MEKERTEEDDENANTMTSEYTSLLSKSTSIYSTTANTSMNSLVLSHSFQCSHANTATPITTSGSSITTTLPSADSSQLSQFSSAMTSTARNQMKYKAVFVFLLTVLILTIRSKKFARIETLDGESTLMNLHLLNHTDKSGAVCLDGTPGGFYFLAATNAANTNNWLINFQGGGWCYDKKDCWERSNGHWGSSSRWPNTQASMGGGMVSSDCAINPDFCRFNRVFLRYCDGNSFSGNRDDGVPAGGTDDDDGDGRLIYFRGRRIMDATLRALAENFGMGHADTVLVTGCSAGGLATYLHADYIHEQLRTKYATKTLGKFRAASMSGFFLQHKTVEGEDVYPEEMRHIFELANSTLGLNNACITAMTPDDQWQCNFAQHAYAFMKADIFVLNSALDSWQTGCIYTSELPDQFPDQKGTNNGNCSAAPGWADCTRNPNTCNESQMTSMNRYITDFTTILNATNIFHKPGNGAFLHSCHTHCEAHSNHDYTMFAVGGVTMREAVSKWWNSDGNDSSSMHTYRPCLYNTNPLIPHECNPTCTVSITTEGIIV